MFSKGLNSSLKKGTIVPTDEEKADEKESIHEKYEVESFREIGNPSEPSEQERLESGNSNPTNEARFLDSHSHFERSVRNSVQFRSAKEDIRRLSPIWLPAFFIAIGLLCLYCKFDSSWAYFTYSNNRAILEDYYVSYPSFQQYMSQKQPSRNFSVLLYGDSLLSRPSTAHNLLGKVRRQLDFNQSLYSVELTMKASSGSTISDLSNQLPAIVGGVNAHKYDAIIVYWDSDLSKRRITTLNSPSYKELYKNRLGSLLHQLQHSYNFTYISVAGPGILGETPLIMRFQNKAYFLDLYRSYNQDICEKYGVPYINMRKALLEEIPLRQFAPEGTVSKDGEHANERGTKVLAEFFAMQINRWMSSG